MKPYVKRYGRGKTLHLFGPFEDERSAVMAMALQEPKTLDLDLDRRGSRYDAMRYRVSWWDDEELRAAVRYPEEHTGGEVHHIVVRPNVQMHPDWKRKFNARDRAEAVQKISWLLKH